MKQEAWLFVITALISSASYADHSESNSQWKTQLSGSGTSYVREMAKRAAQNNLDSEIKYYDKVCKAQGGKNYSVSPYPEIQCKQEASVPNWWRCLAGAEVICSNIRRVSTREDSVRETEILSATAIAYPKETAVRIAEKRLEAKAELFYSRCQNNRGTASIGRPNTKCEDMESESWFCIATAGAVCTH